METKENKENIMRAKKEDNDQLEHVRKRVNVGVLGVAELERITLFLKTNNPGTSISHREKEKANIIKFLLKNLTEEKQRQDNLTCMLVFGQPGLGKTILLQEISNKFKNGKIADLIKEINSEEIKDFEFNLEKIKAEKILIHFFNSANYNYVSEILKDILSKVFKDKSHKDYNDSEYLFNQIKQLLPKLLKKQKLILMIDELEYLLNNDPKNFSVIISLLNYNFNGFIKFGISNTLEVHKDIRLNFEFNVFKVYNKNSLKEIVLKRIDDALEGSNIISSDVFTDNVLNYIIMGIIKNEKGDVRALLSSVSKFAENKIEELKNKNAKGEEITKKDLSTTITAVIDFNLKGVHRKHVELLGRLNPHCQLILLAIYKTLSEKDYIIGFKEVEKEYKKFLANSSTKANDTIENNIGILKSYDLVNLKKRNDKIIKIKSSLTKLQLERILVKVEELKPFFNE